MAASTRTYTSLLLFIAGLGGFLYGYDIGIIGAALLYLHKAITLTVGQESLVVAAVLAGGTVSSLVAGACADVIGRKKLMIAAGALFLASVLLIVTAHGFVSLFLGRTLQGLSAGMIAVVIPLYLAECLPANIRGRGTAAFQLMLTVGILIAAAVGAHYTRGVEAVSSGAPPETLLTAQDQAWRAMFMSAIYPGALYLLGAFFVSESPRWLFRRNQREAARAALLRSRAPADAEAELTEMAVSAKSESGGVGQGPLWQRKYILPFVLSCAVLGLTQATGINSILQFIVVILQKAGLPASIAAEKATYVTAVNVAMTIVGLLLVDKLGRKALLKLGTGGIAVALATAAVVFFRVEAAGSVASEASGNIVMASLMVFIGSFAVGPGVCVWLALSELMPTRIRSVGMGLGLLINQGISTAIAAAFLPVVSRFGYSAMFIGWAICAVVYFLVAALWLPETKGKTLEEIEAEFDRRAAT